MFSGMLAGFLKVAAVAVVSGGFVGGIYWAVQIGGSEDGSAFGQTEPSVTVTITPESTAQPTATQEPVPTDAPAPTATPQPPAQTATPQPPAQTATPPGVGCPKRMHNHLNIDKLRLQPGMTDAVITEIDDSSIRIVLQGVEFVVSGWGDVIGIRAPRDLSNELLDQVVLAIDAVENEC